MENKKRKQNKWQKPVLETILFSKTKAKPGGARIVETAQTCYVRGAPPNVFWNSTNELHHPSPNTTDIKHAYNKTALYSGYTCDTRGAAGPGPS